VTTKQHDHIRDSILAIPVELFLARDNLVDYIARLPESLGEAKWWLKEAVETNRIDRALQILEELRE
jgi:hypothetical protein